MTLPELLRLAVEKKLSEYCLKKVPPRCHFGGLLLLWDQADKACAAWKEASAVPRAENGSVDRSGSAVVFADGTGPSHPEGSVVTQCGGAAPANSICRRDLASSGEG